MINRRFNDSKLEIATVPAIENTRTLAFDENTSFGEGLLELKSSKTGKFGTDKTVLSFILPVELASSTPFDLESFIVPVGVLPRTRLQVAMREMGDEQEKFPQ